jgi:hypothetical protein
VLAVWGVEWIAGNLASQFAPGLASAVWTAGTLIGVALSFWLSWRPGRAGKGGRAAATALAIFVFFLCLFSILRLTDMRELDAVISLAVGSAYVVLGVWTGARYAGLGVAVVAAVMAGWFLFPAVFFVWMAVVGGGALLLGGLWLSRA